jgi:hypothetical protein
MLMLHLCAQQRHAVPASAAELERAGHLNERGTRYSAASVQHMLAQRG